MSRQFCVRSGNKIRHVHVDTPHPRATDVVTEVMKSFPVLLPGPNVRPELLRLRVVTKKNEDVELNPYDSMDNVPVLCVLELFELPDKHPCSATGNEPGSDCLMEVVTNLRDEVQALQERCAATDWVHEENASLLGALSSTRHRLEELVPSVCVIDVLAENVNELCGIVNSASSASGTSTSPKALNAAVGQQLLSVRNEHALREATESLAEMTASVAERVQQSEARSARLSALMEERAALDAEIEYLEPLVQHLREAKTVVYTETEYEDDVTTNVLAVLHKLEVGLNDWCLEAERREARAANPQPVLSVSDVRDLVCSTAYATRDRTVAEELRNLFFRMKKALDDECGK
eukprot:PhM_4_TR9463/c0_g1_i1/m.22158